MFGKKTDFMKRLDYDLVKQTKKENFLLLNEKYSRENQTVLIGDSITEIFNWYELFYEYTERTNQAVYNRGISGDTSYGLLNRIKENALNIKPKNMVVLIGTNDIGLKAPVSFIADCVEKIIAQTKEICPETNIILTAVYPVNGVMSKEAKAMVGFRNNKTVAELNIELKKLSASYNTVWLDITKPLSDSSGNLAQKYTYDGLHLNAVGYELVAENIIPLLKI